MKNLDLKMALCSVLLLFSFLKMEGQTLFAVVNQDSVDAFMEEVFFEKNEDRNEFRALNDSLGSQNITFFITKQHWAMDCQNSCLSPKQENMMTTYLQLLEKNIIAHVEKSDSFFLNIDENAHLILDNHIENFLTKKAKTQRHSFLVNTKDVLFHDKNIPDLTAQVLENLNQNKTILSQQLYFKEAIVSSILKMNSEIDLMDYETFKENYDSE